MNAILTYRGRRVTDADVAFLRKLIADVPIDRTPVRASLRELQPLAFRQVRRTQDEPLFNALLAQHHELGYVHRLHKERWHEGETRGHRAGHSEVGHASANDPSQLG